MDRRTFIGVTGVGIATISVATVLGMGLLSDEGSLPDDKVSTPSGTTLMKDSLEEVTSDSLAGFELTLSHQEIQFGETLTVSLTNHNQNENTSGTKSKYLIQKRYDGVWRSIYKREGELLWFASGVRHKPGEGFTWELPIKRSGIDHSKEALVSLQPLRPGQYRVVYFGVSSLSQEYDGIAKQFEITGN